MSRNAAAQAQQARQDVLAGIVKRVTFHNEENGFCVLRVKAALSLDAIENSLEIMMMLLAPEIIEAMLKEKQQARLRYTRESLLNSHNIPSRLLAEDSSVTNNFANPLRKMALITGIL